MAKLLGAPEHLGYSERQLLPGILFNFELTATRFSEFIVFRSTVVFGGSPVGLDPTTALQSMERGI
jgi:hypothetical protein